MNMDFLFSTEAVDALARYCSLCQFIEEGMQ